MEAVRSIDLLIYMWYYCWFCDVWFWMNQWEVIDCVECVIVMIVLYDVYESMVTSSWADMIVTMIDSPGLFICWSHHPDSDDYSDCFKWYYDVYTM